MSNKPYSYSKGNNSVIIKSTKLPKDWCNYLWSNQGYVGSFTQAGHGESYYIDEKANMCELNSNQTRYVYLRDEESKTCWNVGEAPLMEPVDEFECEHHIGFSEIRSKKDEICASIRYFIPGNGFHEIWTVRLTNGSDRKRHLSVFSVVDFYLEGFDYPRYHEMQRTLDAGFENKLNGVFCRSNHHYAPHSKYNAFIASSEKVFASDAHLKQVLGGTGSYARPIALLSGKDCSNTRRSCYDIGGVLQNKVSLEPGETREINIVYGLADSVEHAHQILKNLFQKGEIERLFTGTIDESIKKYASLSCHTPNERLNQLMNNWGKKQVDFCIVGKKGVRDNAQISSALLMYRPEVARREILEILRHQYKSGNAVLTWLPLDETRYSDQAFWIVWAITELIKETGDYSVLEELVEYQDGGEGTVFEHMKAGIKRLLDDRGKNGLVRIFYADWNDALNILDDDQAESVMLSHQFCLAVREMAEICKRTGDKEYVQFLTEKYNEVKSAINKNAWDGEWYLRVLSDKGNVGGQNSSGSRIYLNPQVWALLAETQENENTAKILSAIDSMEHDFGFPINSPPNVEYSDHTGRMSLMAPGLYENGGVYCHASAFKVMMDSKMGRAEEAVRTLLKIIPDSEYNPYSQSETEPYVFTNCYSTHPDAYGKADRSWITGTSAWCLKGLYEGILGIMKDYDGLRISPNLPANWDKVEVTRQFRNAIYKITFVKDSSLVGKGKTIWVDGNRIEDELLPVFNDNKTHEVKVVIT